MATSPSGDRPTTARGDTGNAPRASSTPAALDPNSVQQIAKDILDLHAQGKIGFNSNSAGSSLIQIQRMARGEKPHTTCGQNIDGSSGPGDKAIDISLNLMQFIRAAGQQTSFSINALTDACHTHPSSNHYAGKAVDVACGANWGILDRVAAKYGGGDNGERCDSGNNHTHYEFLSGPTGSGLDAGGDGQTGTGVTTPGVTGGADTADTEAIAKATAFSTFLNLPGILDREESLSLKGERSLMNDKPLLPYVQQICAASLRSFQSMPNGNFYAFFPDYFGGFGWNTPYWEVHDIEIIDAQIDLSDESLATHVYTVGDVSGNFGGVDTVDRQQTGGVMTLFNAFFANFLNGVPEAALQAKTRKEQNAIIEENLKNKPNLATKEAAIAFIKKYGARPYYEEFPMVRSPYYEAFLAYQKFMLMWSRQFLTTITTTFMPELYPGGIISFPEHGFQVYIDEVEHQCNYESGFVTRLNVSSPASLPSAERQHLYAGMIRSFPNSAA